MIKLQPLNQADYEEEAVPFDDVMRQLLQAKPNHREAENPKASKKKKSKTTKKG